jgi:CHRD domain
MEMMEEKRRGLEYTISKTRHGVPFHGKAINPPSRRYTMRYRNLYITLAVLLFGAITLSACGGGGGGSAPPPPMLDVATLKADGYYFNVHTSLCTAGEIRGQIDVDPLATGQQTITTILTSAQEVPTCGPGTGSGAGTLVVNFDTGVVISASITTTSGLSGAVTAAHIHEGPLGSNVPGTIVLALPYPSGGIGY